MGASSKIEWTDSSWSPICARNKATGKIGWRCEHVSPGHRDDVEIFLDEKMLLVPLRWQKPRMIYVCSMTDIFADFVTDAMIDKLFAVMALAPQHTFQVLTKRSGRMREYMAKLSSIYPTALAEAWARVSTPLTKNQKQAALKNRWPQGGMCLGRTLPWPVPNVWLGVSVEDQPRADERIPDLLATLAAVRFVSAEPLLGPIDFCVKQPLVMYRALDWVIVGGESGHGARPMHPDWARAIRDQCAGVGVPFFFKQWGGWEVAIDRERDDPDWRRDYTHALRDGGQTKWLNLAGGCGFHGERFHVMRRVGKKRAGRLLDGVEHNAMPEAPSNA